MASTKQNVPPQPPNVYQLIRGEARGEERTHFAGSAQYYYCSITYQAWQAPSGMTSDVLSLCGVQGDTCIEVVVVRMTKLTVRLSVSSSPLQAQISARHCSASFCSSCDFRPARRISAGEKPWNSASCRIGRDY